LRILKYIFIWVLLSIPFVIPSLMVWLILGEKLAVTGVKFEHLIAIPAILSASLLLFFYLMSSRILLKWYGAREVKDGDILEIFERVAKESDVAAKLYVVESEMPNAYYAGNSKKGFIVITTSLIKLLDDGELEAVMNNQFVHLRNRESMIYTIGATISGLVVSLSTAAYWCSLLTGFGLEDDPAPNLIKLFVMSLVAPLASFLSLPIFSGKKEFNFDVESISSVEDENKLISAMEKINSSLNSGNYEINPAHSILFFANPLKDDYVNILDFNLPTYLSILNLKPSVARRICEIQGVKPESSGGSLIKPIFYSLISHFFVLFGIIAFDTFNNKDFVFERAALISVVFLGWVTIFFSILILLLRFRRRF